MSLARRRSPMLGDKFGSNQSKKRARPSVAASVQINFNSERALYEAAVVCILPKRQK